MLSLKEASGQRTTLYDYLQQFVASEEAYERAVEKMYRYRTDTSKDNRSEEEVQADIDKQFNSSYNDIINGRREELQARQDAYNDLQNQIKDLQAYLKTLKGKDTKEERNEVKADIKQLQKDSKAVKLNSTEKRILKDLEFKHDVILGNLEDSKLYQNLQKQIAKLENKQMQLAEKGKDLSKGQYKNLEKYLNQVDLLESFQENMSEIFYGSADVMNSATYNQIVGEVQKLVNKKNLNNKQTEKLQMYQDELLAMQTGATSGNITQYRSVYEKWWALQQKSLSKTLNNREKYQLEQYTQQKEVMEAQRAAADDVLREEMQRAQGKAANDFNLKQRIREAQANYKDQIQTVENSYISTKTWKDIAQNKKYTPLMEYQMEWLKKAGTGDNTKNKAIADSAKWIFNRLNKFNQGKLSQSEASRWDTEMNSLKQAEKAKATEIEVLQRELQDYIDTLTLQYQSQDQQNQQEVYEAKQKIYEYAKSVAEFEINAAKEELEYINQVIDRQEQLLELYKYMDANVAKGYGVDTEGIEDSLELLKKYYNELLYGKDDGNGNRVGGYEQAIAQYRWQKELYDELIEAAYADGDFTAVFAKYNEVADDTTKEMLEKVKQTLLETNFDRSTWVAEWQAGATEAESAIFETIMAMQQMKDEMREEISFRVTKDAIEQLDLLNTKLSAMNSIILDDWVRDVNGVTSMGYTKAAILYSQLQNSQQQVAQYAQHVADVISVKDTYASEKAYLTDLNNAYADYYNSISSTEELLVEVYNIGKEIEEAEINRIEKLIDVQKKALQSKKDYYEYDKNIKSQTKNIEALQAQIDALNGVNTAAAKAKRAQLESQLSDAQENLRDTQIEHEFDLQMQGLDEFIDKLNDTLDDANKTLDETFEHFTKIIQEVLEGAASHDVTGDLQKVLDLFMGDIHIDAGAFLSGTISEDDLSNLTKKLDDLSYFDSPWKDEYGHSTLPSIGQVGIPIYTDEEIAKLISDLRKQIKSEESDYVKTKAYTDIENGNVKKDLQQRFDELIDHALNDYQNTKAYQNIVHKVNKTDAEEYALEWLERAGTDNNSLNSKIVSYAKWLSKYQDKYDSDTLTKSQLKTWDKYTTLLEGYEAARNNRVDSLEEELKETLIELKLRQKEQLELLEKAGTSNDLENQRLLNNFNKVFDLRDAYNEGTLSASKQKEYEAALKAVQDAIQSRADKIANLQQQIVDYQTGNYVKKNEILYDNISRILDNTNNSGIILTAQNNDVSKLLTQTLNSVQSNSVPNQINFNYDNLLNVEGSVDATVLNDLQSILENSYQYTASKLYEELAKLGFKRTY